MKTFLKQVSLTNSVTIAGFMAILFLNCLFTNTLVAQTSNKNNSGAVKAVESDITNAKTQEAEIIKTETVFPVSNDPVLEFSPNHPGNKTNLEAKKQAEKNGTKFLNVEPERKKVKQ